MPSRPCPRRRLAAASPPASVAPAASPAARSPRRPPAPTRRSPTSPTSTCSATPSTRPTRPGTRRTGSPRSPRSACCGPTPSRRDGVLTSASAAGRTTRRPTPGARARSTPTTSRRAAVVYLRHWQATGSTSSRDAAYEMLRGLTYLQTASGPNAGNVVLWMQPDGTLTPAPSRWSCPTRPTATRRTGWPARSGRSARATPPSRTTPTRAFAAFLATGSSSPSTRSTARCSTRTASYAVIDGGRRPPG